MTRTEMRVGLRIKNKHGRRGVIVGVEKDYIKVDWDTSPILKYVWPEAYRYLRKENE